jgi:hypothetical protein
MALNQFGEQNDQALAFHGRQPAPVHGGIALHAGLPAISQAPTMPCSQVLAAIVGLSKTPLQRFPQWDISIPQRER